MHRILRVEVAESPPNPGGAFIVAGDAFLKQEERRTGRLRATIRGLAGTCRVETE
jgi:hypothetical protein